MVSQKLFLTLSSIIFFATITVVSYIFGWVGFILCFITILSAIGIVLFFVKRKIKKEDKKIDDLILVNKDLLEKQKIEQSESTKLREEMLNARRNEERRVAGIRKDERSIDKIGSQGGIEGNKQLENVSPINNGTSDTSNSEPERNSKEDWANFS